MKKALKRMAEALLVLAFLVSLLFLLGEGEHVWNNVAGLAGCIVCAWTLNKLGAFEQLKQEDW